MLSAHTIMTHEYPEFDGSRTERETEMESAAESRAPPQMLAAQREWDRQAEMSDY